jgi:hypothetical protein
VFKDRYRLFASHAFKLIKKLMEAHAGFKVGEQCIHRYARPAKTEPTAKTIGVAPYWQILRMAGFHVQLS